MSPRHFPLAYELNTRCWLQELSEQHGAAITLDSVPARLFEQWAETGFTHIWLMGVWTTGPRSRRHALSATGLDEVFNCTLPGWKPSDVGGSPFAPAGYRVPASFGGEAGLQQFRENLHAHGLRLLLDFVPNHVGLDHPWLNSHPEYFVQSSSPAEYTFEQAGPDGPRYIAHGKDPNFPAWTDTAQLDFRRLDTQRAVARALHSIAQRCDGVRCDMAMLLLRDVFASTWQQFPPAQPPPEGEFWSNLIRQIRQNFPDFLLLAEAYWDLEARLQSLGFDYTYDKRLYDHLVARNPSEARRHLLGANRDFLESSAHFLENHDEPRVASLLQLPEHRAAALATLSLPGLRLLHDGQLEGRRTRLPVQLCRRPTEAPDPDLTPFYHNLLRTLRQTTVGSGRADLLPTRPAWPDNPSHENVIVIQWRSSQDEFDLVVVNLAPHRSQCYVGLSIPDLANRNWRMHDLLGPEEYQRYGDDLHHQGLYLDIAPNAAQLFHFTPLS